MRFLKIFIVGLSSFLFSSCNLSLTYDYLMQHPERLQKEISRCAISDDASCILVKEAAQDFIELVNERREDPEEFGLKILRAQQQFSKQASSEQFKKIQILYAVIRATSAE